MVIISDYMMPGMDGVAFLNQRARGSWSGPILCTAADDFRVALEAVNSGEVYRIISKPWHQAELVTTVCQAAEAARLRRENDRLTAEVQRQNGQLREMNTRLEEMVRARTQALLEGSSPRSITATPRPSGTRSASRSSRSASRGSSGSTSLTSRPSSTGRCSTTSARSASATACC